MVTIAEAPPVNQAYLVNLLLGRRHLGEEAHVRERDFRVIPATRPDRRHTLYLRTVLLPSSALPLRVTAGRLAGGENGRCLKIGLRGRTQSLLG